ncbi:hypothetical protein HDU97_002840 [Phlyctochytrium planicorne]|nr:hypothetical protein HDU97_002840 [Phlyctochytrium planicorne]
MATISPSSSLHAAFIQDVGGESVMGDLQLGAGNCRQQTQQLAFPDNFASLTNFPKPVFYQQHPPVFLPQHQQHVAQHQVPAAAVAYPVVTSMPSQLIVLAPSAYLPPPLPPAADLAKQPEFAPFTSNIYAQNTIIFHNSPLSPAPPVIVPPAPTSRGSAKKVNREPRKPTTAVRKISSPSISGSALRKTTQTSNFLAPFSGSSVRNTSNFSVKETRRKKAINQPVVATATANINPRNTVNSILASYTSPQSVSAVNPLPLKPTALPPAPVPRAALLPATSPAIPNSQSLATRPTFNTPPPPAAPLAAQGSSSQDLKSNLRPIYSDNPTSKPVKETPTRSRRGGLKLTCNLCEKTFHRRDHLQSHIQIDHENIPRFRCEQGNCLRSFKRKHDLRRHERTSHTTITYNCEVDGCKMTFKRVDVMRRHARRHQEAVERRRAVTNGLTAGRRWAFPTHMFEEGVASESEEIDDGAREEEEEDSDDFDPDQSGDDPSELLILAQKYDEMLAARASSQEDAEEYDDMEEDGPDVPPAAETVPVASSSTSTRQYPPIRIRPPGVPSRRERQLTPRSKKQPR